MELYLKRSTLAWNGFSFSTNKQDDYRISPVRKNKDDAENTASKSHEESKIEAWIAQSLP